MAQQQNDLTYSAGWNNQVFNEGLKEMLGGLEKLTAEVRKMTGALGTETEKTMSQFTGHVRGAAPKVISEWDKMISVMKKALMGLGIYFSAQFITQSIVGGFQKGIKAVDDFKISVAATAATLTSLARFTTDWPGAFKVASGYAADLVNVLEAMSVQTLMTGKELMMMSEQFAQFGVILDINNRKALEGFKAIANAIAIMTQGMNRELQIRQEIRSLAQGQARAVDQLGRFLKNIYGTDLPALTAEWKRQGVLLERIGETLKGFSIAGKDLTQTWTLFRNVLETISNKILRTAFLPFFSELTSYVSKLASSAMDLQGNLTGWALDASEAIRGLLPNAKTLVDTMIALGKATLFLIEVFNETKGIIKWAAIIASIIVGSKVLLGVLAAMPTIIATITTATIAATAALISFHQVLLLLAAAKIGWELGEWVGKATDEFIKGKDSIVHWTKEIERTKKETQALVEENEKERKMLGAISAQINSTIGNWNDLTTAIEKGYIGMSKHGEAVELTNEQLLEFVRLLKEGKLSLADLNKQFVLTEKGMAISKEAMQKWADAVEKAQAQKGLLTPLEQLRKEKAEVEKTGKALLEFSQASNDTKKEMEKEYFDVIKYYNQLIAQEEGKEAEKQMQLDAKVSQFIKQNILSEYEYERWALQQEYNELVKASGKTLELEQALVAGLKLIDDKYLAEQIKDIEKNVKQRQDIFNDLEKKIIDLSYDEWTSKKLILNLEVKQIEENAKEIMKTDADKSEFRIKMAEYTALVTAQIEKDRLKELQEEEEKRLKEAKQAYDDFYGAITDDIVDMFDAIVGEGEDLEDWWKDWTERLKSYFLKLIATMVTSWAFGMQDMQKVTSGNSIFDLMMGKFTGIDFGGMLTAQVAAQTQYQKDPETGQMVPVTTGGGLGNLGFGMLGNTWGALKSGFYSMFPSMSPEAGMWTGAGETAQFFNTPFSFSGYAGMAGPMALLSGLLTGNWGASLGSFAGGAAGGWAGGALGSTLGMSWLGPIGMGLGALGGGFLGDLFGGLFGEDHEQRRIQRGVDWSSEFTGMMGAQNWEDIIKGMSTYPFYFGGRTAADQYTATGNWPEYQQAITPMETTNLQLELSGWSKTELAEAMSKEDYLATLGTYDNMVASVTQTLDENKTATLSSADALSEYKDVIDLVVELMPSWGEAGQQAGQAMIDFYTQLQNFIISDIFDKFIEGTLKWSDVVQELTDMGLTPLESSLKQVDLTMNSLLNDLEIGSDLFFTMYGHLHDAATAVNDYNGMIEDAMAIQEILVSGISLTNDELVTLVTYYRMLNDVLEGNEVVWEDLIAIQTKALAIINAMTVATENLTEAQKLSIQYNQLLLGGKTEAQATIDIMGQKYGMPGTEMTTGYINEVIAWASTVPLSKLEEVATQHGLTVEELITDLMSLDTAVESVAESIATVAYAQRVAGGYTTEEATYMGIRERWGWGQDTGKGEIIEALQWASQMPTEDLIAFVESMGLAGVTAETLASDMLFLADYFGLTADSLGDLDDQIDDVTDSIEKWQDVVDSIRDQINEYQFSLDNPQNAVERLSLVKAEIERVMGGMDINQLLKGLPEDEQIAMIEQLQDLWDQYISVAQEAYQRPSLEYQAIFDEVNSALNELLKYSEGKLTEYQIQLQQLDYLKQIAENTTPLGDKEVPSYQIGTDYITHDTFARVHQGEAIVSAWANKRNYSEDMPLGDITININESKNVRKTEDEVYSAMKRFMRSSKGRQITKKAAGGK